MSALRNYINKIKPNFQEGGKLHAFRSVFDGFETFLYVPNETAKSGTNIQADLYSAPMTVVKSGLTNKVIIATTDTSMPVVILYMFS